jgi:hypothetical protein
MDSRVNLKTCHYGSKSACGVNVAKTSNNLISPPVYKSVYKLFVYRHLMGAAIVVSVVVGVPLVAIFTESELGNY